ncbi:MAG TPA: alpha/beta fold hydrolase [Geminicoccaceae bacterium]|nr:alpha/beta fold hydrolase [Geminicoccaceae bacterium]
MNVGHDTHGALNEARDNAILVTHGTSGGRPGYDAHIGPGLALDSDRHFVVTVDAIGGGDPSKPPDGPGTDLPGYNIRDMGRAQHHLLTEGLGVTRLAAVGGPSMGAFQALEWGVQHPDSVDNLLVIAGAPHADRLFEAVIDTFVGAMQLDPRRGDGHPDTNATDGLEVAGMVFTPWLYSDGLMTSLQDDGEFDWLLRSMGRGWAEGRRDVDWMYRYRAARSHDIAAPFDGDMDAALGAIEARTLIVHVSTDRPFPERHARRMDEGIADSVLRVVESDRGHMGCCRSDPSWAEYQRVSAAITEFLDGEARVAAD